MDVQLLDFDKKEMVNRIAIGCYTCTNSSYQKYNSMDLYEREQLIKRVVNKKHYSVLRHYNFSFLINDCSRVLTHQLVRHQAGFAFSQRSLRYTKISDEIDDFYVLPLSLYESCYLSNIKKIMNEVKNLYLEMIDNNIKPEDARYILPIGVKTSIVVSMNGEAVINFLKSRLCKRAQYEIRTFAMAVKDLLKKNEIDFYNDIGPDCKNCAETCVHVKN